MQPHATVVENPLRAFGGGSRQFVLEVLAREWPLTARQVFERIRNRGLGITYQAVHKVLGQLSKEGITERSGKGYLLSRQWVFDLKHFAEKLDLSQESSNAIHPLDLEPGQSTTVKFQHVKEMARFLLDFLERETRSHPPTSIIWHWRRAWMRKFFGWQAFPQLERVMKWPTIILVRETSAADCRRARFYQQAGAKVRMKVDCADINDVLVVNDYVVNVHFAVALRKAWDEFCKPGKRDQAEFYRVIEKIQKPTYLIIMRNEDIANQYLQGTRRRI